MVLLISTVLPSLATSSFTEGVRKISVSQVKSPSLNKKVLLFAASRHEEGTFALSRTFREARPRKICEMRVPSDGIADVREMCCWTQAVEEHFIVIVYFPLPMPASVAEALLWLPPILSVHVSVYVSVSVPVVKTVPVVAFS